MKVRRSSEFKSIFRILTTLIVIVVLAVPYSAFAQDESPTDAVITDTATPESTQTDEPTFTPTVEEPTEVTPTPTLEVTSEPTLTETPTETPAEIPTEFLTETPTPEFTFTDSPIDSSDTQPKEFKWEYKIAFPKGLEKKADLFVSQMNSLDIPGSRSNRSSAMESVQFKGNRDTNEARKAMFPGKNTGFGIIDGASDVNLLLPINTTDPISIHLESDLSTGYSWQVVRADVDGTNMTYDSQFINRGSGAVPQVQVMTFYPTTTGTATIQVVYRRPFNLGEASTRSLDISYAEETQSVDLSNPTPELGSSTADTTSSTSASSDVPTGSASSTSTPYIWDWRTFGAVTPIRDQGAYGTCWAFSTNGTMEANMLVNGGPSVNLSEQFLVSCNKVGFTANSGGYPLHDYHTTVIANQQSVTGAVLESDMPYNPSSATCKVISNHPYKLSNWGYTTYGTPDTVAIKAALYTHGPVSSGVCVGSSFSSYSGGYFTKDESANCGGGINHYIVLVGWKDVSATEGYWILRNSWGTGWGESGYMYIKYGISSVGQWTSYVDYTATGSPATISPTSSVSTATPAFSWKAVTNATSYEIQVFQNNAVVLDNTVSASVCSGTTCSTTLTSNLPNGDVYWRVRALVSGTWGTYTRPVGLTVSAPVVTSTTSPTATPTTIPTLVPTIDPTVTPTTKPTTDPTAVPSPTPTTNPPSAPSVISPAGNQSNNQPTFKWNAKENANTYLFKVYSYTRKTVVYTTSLKTSDATCTNGVCSFTPGSKLDNDNYNITIAAANSAGTSSYSNPSDFSVCSTSGFSYQFSSNAVCWSPTSGGKWVSGATNYYSSGKAKYWSTTRIPISYADFTFTARVKRNGSYESGLVFRGSPSTDSTNKWKSGYFFTYKNNGTFRVYKRVNGTAKVLVGWKTSAAIKKNNWNDLKVVTSGSSIYCYINNVLVWKGTDSSLKSGQEGFTFYHGGTGLAYYIDSAILTKK